MLRGLQSRGQARTVVLALKLAEARLISESIGDQPVILLDDVMSELDPGPTAPCPRIHVEV